jgi:Ni/Fe-hydrogenase subunit HybB-like protein
MKENPNHIKPILNMVAIAFAVFFFIIASQTSVKAAQPMVAASGYYKYSPPVANFIAKHDSLRAMVRISLLPIVGIISACLG